MTPRRVLSAACVAALVFLLVKRQSPAELRGRGDRILETAALPLEARRIAAASSDFDRRYALLLEWARRNLPPDSPGVVVVTERPIAGRRAYLAVYHFAPTPTVVRSSDPPPGWLVLIQGSQRPPGWKIVAESPHGALLAPPA